MEIKKYFLKRKFEKMKKFISKEVIDNAIKSSDNLEGLLTVVISALVVSVVSKLITTKAEIEENKGGNF